LVLVFFEGRRGDTVSRLPNGKIALVNKRAQRKPKAGEKWLCRIDFEKPNFAIITPLAKIVRKEIPKLAEYNCGHRLPLNDGIREYIELPENEEPQPRIIYFDKVCSECLKKYEGAELSEIDDFEVFKTLYFEQKNKLREKIAQLSNKKIELKNSAILAVPEKNITGVCVIGHNYVDVMDCPYCNGKIPVKELENGQRFRCDCGAEFTKKVVVKDKEGDGYVPRHIDEAYSYSMYLIDHKKEKEIEPEIRKIDEEIGELERKLTELDKLFDERREKWFREELKKHGVVEVKWDVDETGRGSVFVKFSDGSEIRGTVDELVWFDDKRYDELARLLMKMSGVDIRVSTKNPVRKKRWLKCCYQK